MTNSLSTSGPMVSPVSQVRHRIGNFIVRIRCRDSARGRERKGGKERGSGGRRGRTDFGVREGNDEF